MKVTFTDEEARDTLSAVKMSGAIHTDLLSRCADKDLRRMLLDVVTSLAKVERKLGG
jgi:hypothetical protein